MTQLFQLEEAISSAKKSIRSPRVDVLKEVEASTMAFKAIEAIDRLVLANAKLDDGQPLRFPIAPIACEIGKNLSDGEEKFLNEREQEISFFKRGAFVLSAIGRDGDVDIKTVESKEIKYTKHKDSETGEVSIVEKQVESLDTYLIIKNVELFLRLSILIPLNDPKQPIKSRPTTRIPLDWTGFNHKYVGKLAGKCSRKVRREFSKHKHSRVLKMLNRQQRTAYLLDEKMLKLQLKLRENDHFLFTHSHKKYDSDKLISLEREQNAVLNVAEKIRDDEFYQRNQAFYHYRNLCFRGRKNTTSVYFKEDGSDLAKSLHSPKLKKRIGIRGYYAILVHLTNSFGEDKLKISERARFAKENLTKWLEWADNPVDTADEWASEVDSPWSFMKALFELQAALAFDNPYDYKSSLPIAWDFTCSGLAILSYITKFQLGGKLTNLEESDERGDAYSHIAAIVMQNLAHSDKAETRFAGLAERMEKIDVRLRKAKEDGNQTALIKAEKAKAKFYNSNIDSINDASNWFWSQFGAKVFRKIAKRPVMTRPYNAGIQTIADALLNDFRGEKGFDGLNSFYCDLMAEQLFLTFNDVFSKAVSAMTEFKKRCDKMADKKKDSKAIRVKVKDPVTGEYGYYARTNKKKMSEELIDAIGIAKKAVRAKLRRSGENYSFTAPFTNWTMEQIYRESYTEQVYIMHNGKRIRPRVIISTNGKINLDDARNGAAPNTVHALDAALLTYIITTCNFNVYAIHDSFAAAPADAWKLYDRTRIAMEQLFKEDVLSKYLKIDGFVMGSLKPAPTKNQFVCS